ncbi:MAG TPA: Hsp20/alpha crystallin family protein [Steroidobacter sp.]|uniref:Hsp20/alpha crystallin family protein n=1 Tax=Steroidobacter sp. TaxID=1978227 RepID=UPI002ED94E20
MAIRNPPSWMWAEACEMLERAQQLQRQFFRFGRAVASEPRWEPPIDILAYGNEVQVAVALPGVAAEHIEVRTDSGLLIVSATRALPIASHATAVHRLEIPYGRFERRIALPEGRYQLLEQVYADGCLVLRLAQR